MEDLPEGEGGTQKRRDIIEVWLNENPKEQKWCRSKGFFQKFLDWFPLLMAATILLCIYFFIQRPFETLGENKDPGEVLNLVANYKTYIVIALFLVVFVGILEVIQIITTTYKNLWPLRCAKWLREHKVDFREALKHESEAFRSGDLKERKKWDGYVILDSERMSVYEYGLYHRKGFCVFLSVFAGSVRVSILLLLSLYGLRLYVMIKNVALYDRLIPVFGEYSMKLWFICLFGIIAAAIVFLIVMMIASYCQVRRFKAAVKNELNE